MKKKKRKKKKKKVKLLSHVQLFAIPWTSRLPGRLLLLCPWNFPGKSTGVGCHFLLQGIFLTQGSNTGLLHCRQTLYCLSHQRSPIILWIILFTIILFTLFPRAMKITFTLFLLFRMYTRLPPLYFIQMHYIASSLLDLLFCEMLLYILCFFLKFIFILYYKMLYSHFNKYILLTEFLPVYCLFMSFTISSLSYFLIGLLRDFTYF